MTRTKLQKMLNKLDGRSEATAKAITDFDSSVKTLRKKLEKHISVETLGEVNMKINKLRKSLDLDPIISDVAGLREEFRQYALDMLKDLEQIMAEAKAREKATEKLIKGEIKGEIKDVNKRADDIEKSVRVLAGGQTEISERLNDSINDIKDSFEERVKPFVVKKDLEPLTKAQSELSKAQLESLDESKKYTDVTKTELLNRILEVGGGQANRNITVGGNASTLSKYTDINFKAGSNVTLTYSNDDTNKRLDITIASSGVGGGNTRQITTVSVSSVLTKVASTDQVIIAGAGIKLTLPTANSDKNLYTIKNKAASSVLLVPAGSDTIDDDSTLILATQYTAVDLISDGTSNWNIT